MQKDEFKKVREYFYSCLNLGGVPLGKLITLADDANGDPVYDIDIGIGGEPILLGLRLKLLSKIQTEEIAPGDLLVEGTVHSTRNADGLLVEIIEATTIFEVVTAEEDLLWLGYPRRLTETDPNNIEHEASKAPNYNK
jgi:hypothetical protein